MPENNDFIAINGNGADSDDNTDLFQEMVNNQLANIPTGKKLQFSDIKRICKYLSASIFDEDCSLWDGYITNMGEMNKSTYINFYFKKKKVALHRLLYGNFVEQLSDDEYLKFTCDNKGLCCTLSHLKKYKYQNKLSAVKNLQNQ